MKASKVVAISTAVLLGVLFVAFFLAMDFHYMGWPFTIVVQHPHPVHSNKAPELPRAAALLGPGVFLPRQGLEAPPYRAS